MYKVLQNSSSTFKKLRSWHSQTSLPGKIDGGKVETVVDFIFLGFKITADGDYSYEIKRHLLLGRIPITNIDSALKSKDITFLTKVCIVKTMVFPVVMYGLPWCLRL